MIVLKDLKKKETWFRKTNQKYLRTNWLTWVKIQTTSVARSSNKLMYPITVTFIFITYIYITFMFLFCIVFVSCSIFLEESYIYIIKFRWMYVNLNEFVYIFDWFLGFIHYVSKYFNFLAYYFMYFVIDFRNFVGFLSNCMETFMVSEIYVTFHIYV